MKTVSRASSRLARRSVAAAVLAAGLLLLSAAPAHAQSAGAVTKFLDTVMQETVKRFMATMGLGVEGAAAQSGAATQAEIQKAAMADKAVKEGLQAYRTEQELRLLAAKTADALEQSPLTCQTVAAQGGIGSASHGAKAKVGRSQARTLNKLASNTNTHLALETSHKQTNEKLCTPQDAALGVCKVSTDARYNGLAGADKNAAYLFQGKDGSLTYAGGADGPQAEAAQGYIDRVVAAMPPEQLRQAEYSTSPQSRVYAELLRRYNAVMSMSSYSLNQIKEGRNPQTGLGTTTSLATVNVAGFTPNKTDMSMLEAVQRLIAVKFSPDAVEAAAKARSPNLILRDMAQTSAYQLWVDHQTLQQDARTEALLAHQLALLTEQTLRPQLEAQRAAATRVTSTPRP